MLKPQNVFKEKFCICLLGVSCIFIYFFRSLHQQLRQELQREHGDLSVQSSLSTKERHLAAVASALWRHFFSFLKSQRMSQIVPLSQLADAAAGQRSLFAS